MSNSSDKLELLTSVAEAFVRSEQAKDFDLIEFDLTWVTLDFGETLLPNVSLKLVKKEKL